MNTQEFVDSLNEKDAWPLCPKCGSNELVMSGPFIGCLHCMFTGSAKPFLNKHPVLTFSRAKALSGPNGIFASIFTGPQNMKAPEQNVRENRRVRMLQVNALSYVAPILAESCIAASAGKVQSPVVAVHPEIGAISRRDLIEITSPFQRQMARIKGASADMSLFIEKVGDNVEITASIFGVPTFVMSAPIAPQLDASWTPVVRYHDINPENAFGIQPVAWEIIPFAEGRIFPVYVASLTVKDSLNVTLAVCEDMEGTPSTKAYQRDPSTPLDYEVKDYQIADSDEAISLFQQKFASMKEQLGSDVTSSFERRWGLDIEIPEILADLVAREQPSWDVMTEARGGTLFR